MIKFVKKNIAVIVILLIVLSYFIIKKKSIENYYNPPSCSNLTDAISKQHNLYVNNREGMTAQICKEKCDRKRKCIKSFFFPNQNKCVLDFGKKKLRNPGEWDWRPYTGTDHNSLRNYYNGYCKSNWSGTHDVTYWLPSLDHPMLKKYLNNY